MSLLRYFSTIITDQKRLDPQRALARDVSSSAISTTNMQFLSDSSFPHVLVDMIAAHHGLHLIVVFIELFAIITYLIKRHSNDVYLGMCPIKVATPIFMY